MADIDRIISSFSSVSSLFNKNEKITLRNDKLDELCSLKLRSHHMLLSSNISLKRFIKLSNKKNNFTSNIHQEEKFITLASNSLGTVHLRSDCLPMIQQKKISNDQLIEAITKKIDRGYDLLLKIFNDNFTSDNSSMEECTDIIWFIYACAEKKVGSFSSGSITVYDDAHRLVSFLDKNKDVYQRISTHLSAFQESPGGVQRAIDTNKIAARRIEDLQFILPHQKKTILYGPLYQGIHGLSSNMTFLKMENHGAFPFSPKGGDRLDGPKSRKRNEHDMKNGLGHGLGYLQSLTRKISGNDNVGNSYRETIPLSVTKMYETMQKRLINKVRETDSIIHAKIKSIIMENEPLHPSSGIHVMMTNLIKLRDDETVSLKIKNEADIYIKELHDECKKNGIIDHFDVRIGKEVILDREELSIP